MHDPKITECIMAVWGASLSELLEARNTYRDEGFSHVCCHFAPIVTHTHDIMTITMRDELSKSASRPGHFEV